MGNPQVTEFELGWLIELRKLRTALRNRSSIMLSAKRITDSGTSTTTRDPSLVDDDIV